MIIPSYKYVDLFLWASMIEWRNRAAPHLIYTRNESPMYEVEDGASLGSPYTRAKFAPVWGQQLIFGHSCAMFDDLAELCPPMSDY